MAEAEALGSSFRPFLIFFQNMPRILVVDEDEHRREAIVEVISRLGGCTVDQCPESDTAKRWLSQASYDVVLVDVRVPGDCAADVYRHLQSTPGCRDTPVLFVTPAGAPSPLALPHGGADQPPVDFLVEPVVPDRLMDRLNFALRLKSLSDQVRLRDARTGVKPLGQGEVAPDLLQERLAESDTLRETFDVFEEAMVLLSSSGGVLVANSAGLRLMASPLRDALLSWSAAVTAPPSEPPHAQVSPPPPPPPPEREFLQGPRTLLGRAYRLSGARLLLYLRDVTNARESEVRRLQAEKLASIGMLAAGVAHEINNPAAFIIGNFDALAAQIRALDQQLRLAGDAETRSKVSGILFEATAVLQESKEGMARIQRIVRDLSSFAHMDEDHVGPTEVNAAVDSTLGILRNELRHRASVDRDLRATRKVLSTSARLGQVFLNLIMNAAQAVDETRAKENRIRVRTYDNGADVVFEVSDNGSGIAPEVLPRVFDSFFTTKPRGIGTGLGLPISQGIVNAIGGEITVETELGRGTMFRVRLPSQAAKREPPTAPATVPKPGKDSRPYRRCRILAVDDEALLLKAYRRMIGDVHELVTALGGREAMQALRKRQDFDVILCDLQMPEMSGMELFMTARKEFPRLADRFVFVTGGAFSSEARQFLEQAVTCLSKPFSVEELMALIEQRSAIAIPTEAAPESFSTSDEDPAKRQWNAPPSDGGVRRTDDQTPAHSFEYPRSRN